MINFNPRSSWEERQKTSENGLSIWDFNPRSSWEERRFHQLLWCRQSIFQSTLLVRGATFPGIMTRAIPEQFQSTLLVRGATSTKRSILINVDISIHAPRERSDKIYANTQGKTVISIHAPRERSDNCLTIPVIFIIYFNPRSSWEERRRQSPYIFYS